MHLMYVSAENTKEASHVFEYFVYYALNVCIYPWKSSTPVRGPLEDSGRIWLSMVNLEESKAAPEF